MFVVYVVNVYKLNQPLSRKNMYTQRIFHKRCLHIWYFLVMVQQLVVPPFGPVNFSSLIKGMARFQGQLMK